MKQNLFYSALFIVFFSFQSSIYDISIQTIHGNNINMSAFANKKIIITTINSVNPITNQLQFLDSLQNADTSLKVIAVPALDFGGTENNDALAALSNTLGLDFTIMKSAFVKKEAGSSQHPLFKWLTDVNENMHFNANVESLGQFFIVSKTGILYSVLASEVPVGILNQILNQSMN